MDRRAGLGLVGARRERRGTARRLAPGGRSHCTTGDMPWRHPFFRLLHRSLLAAALAGAAACAPARYRDPAAPAPVRRPALVQATVGAADTLDGHLVEPVRLRDARGLTVDLLLKRPVATDTGGGRVPVVVILGGHHAGREAARYIPDTRGRVVAALSYPYRGKHRLSAWGALRAAPSIRRAMLDTPPAIQLALDWLLAQPWADTTRVEGIGASLGAPYMTVAAARDPRITRLWAVHGAGDMLRLLSHNTRKYVRLKPARWLAVRAAHRLIAGAQLTPERWIAHVSP